jgi:hypothetical protein
VGRASDTSPPYAASFDTHAVRDGGSAVTATAYDAAGHTSSRTTTITVDNTAPSLDVTGPDRQTFGPGASEHWALAAGDTTSGVASVQCSVVPSAERMHLVPCSQGATGHSVSGLPEGGYVITVRAVDRAGNARDVARTFSVDATPPDSRVTSGPGDAATTTATSLAWTFASTESGSSFRCRVYPAALTPGAFGPCTSASGHAASGFAPGTYAFEVVATDAAGNVDPTPAKRTFTVAAASTVPSPASPPALAPAAAVRSAKTRRPLVTLAYQYRSTRTRTRLTRLVVKHVPRGSTVTARCPRGCARKSYRKLRAHGTVSLRPLIRRSLKPRTTITVTVSHTGFTSTIKRLEIRKRHSPRVRTYCRQSGAKHLSRC